MSSGRSKKTGADILRTDRITWRRHSKADIFKTVRTETGVNIEEWIILA